MRRLPLEAYKEGILHNDRLVLGRAITLVESTLPADRALATQLVREILPYAGRSVRVGVTGVPGVGKSTFIEAFGNFITEKGTKLAVLAVDPSSGRTGGSILADKTRMESLVNRPSAFVRPSPAGGTLGGVARSTRQSIVLCEAAGYEVVIVETVGVGQSETSVCGMVDFFLLLMLAGAGDELQGIKRGIMEKADAVVITKADGANKPVAEQAGTTYRHALHLLPPAPSGWVPVVHTCSALTGAGIADIWHTLTAYQQLVRENGYFARKRREQNLQWLHEALRHDLLDLFYTHPAVQERLPDLEARVQAGRTEAVDAARQLLDAYFSDRQF